MKKCILCPPNLPKNVSSIDNCVLYLETRVWSEWKIGVKIFLEFSASDYLVRTQKKSNRRQRDYARSKSKWVFFTSDFFLYTYTMYKNQHIELHNYDILIVLIDA